MTPPVRLPRPRPGELTPDGIRDAFAHRMMYTVAKDEFTATPFDVYRAIAYAVRDRLMERWFHTQDAYYRADVKRVYYLSLEFLQGRALINNALSLGARDATAKALLGIGYDLEEIVEQEWDAGLGNGGLGRLASCLMDSAATLGLPFYGYGIRYDYGIFLQRISDGQQVEVPDNWLRYGNPWEIPRPDAIFPVSFHGHSEHRRDADGRLRVEWRDTQDVWAMAYDTPVAGYRNDTVNTLRLWSAKSSREFDLACFNVGEYVRAVEDKTRSESISKVLYPPDDQVAGKELRLKQQYFFVSATLQDVLRRFRKRGQRRWDDLPGKVAIQLNDTHPTLAIPELMRVLVDVEGLAWDEAWGITQKIFAYTNHTILPEALERWPAELLGRLLPRHLEIIEEIDRRFRATVALSAPQDPGRVERTAVVDGARQVRMAHLAFVGSHSVNGVAALHTRILQASAFADLASVLPGRINNKTNGITPRRWLLLSNPELASLVTETIGEAWVTDLSRLARLREHAAERAFRDRWIAVKRKRKAILSEGLKPVLGFALDPDALFDVQVKRIHEYKRQLLNVLHVLALYLRLREGRDIGAPRAVLFAGKAAPGYAAAKLIIRLIHAVADLVNAEPRAQGRLQVAFLPNYRVSLAEKVFPACDLSEQISTAGTEASGTGNMKSTLNGGVIIGTLDGANVEIGDAVGPGNMFIFGNTVEQISALRASGAGPRAFIEGDEELRAVLGLLEDGAIARRHGDLFRSIADTLRGHDPYFHCADFRSYLDAQRRAGDAYADAQGWARLSIANTAGTGPFSSDRTTAEYAKDIWQVSAVRPGPPEP